MQSICDEFDDREEGEIVDDDFEDISDNSIIVPIFSGKSVSSREHLPAISLSSVVEVDEGKSEKNLRHRHKIARKKFTKTYRKRKISHRKSACSNSDSDSDYLDKQLHKQLKVAITVDDTEERHKNSLRSRLKGMVKLDESDSCTEKNSNSDKVEQKDTSDEGDSELAQLRIEALRTAVLNKFKYRKRRRVKENIDTDVMSDVSVKTDNSETNKENSHNMVENCPKKLCAENPVQSMENKIEITNNIVIENITPPEDDEDVLRALLLASISKKITKESETKKFVMNNSIKYNHAVVEQQKEPIKTIVNNTVAFKKQKSKHISKDLQLQKVKPLIININEDSDSEEDFASQTTIPAKNVVTETVEVNAINKQIENTVDQFLKQQRAQVEAQLSPRPKIPVTVTKNSPSDILEKSSVKLLPKVKQKEYKELLQKLNNAEKKQRNKKLLFKSNGQTNSLANTSKKIVRNRVLVNKLINTVSKREPVQDTKNELRMLGNIMKEIGIERNGRLQVQEKYKVLMPFINKINEANTERRKHEEHVKRLLEEVADSKKQVLSLQQDFNTYVKDLVQEKQRIDKSMELKISQDKKARFTSTPIRVKPPAVSFDGSSVPTPLSREKLSDPVAAIEKEVEIVVDEALKPEDRNDSDPVSNTQKSTVPKYISPLDNVKRVVSDDPFSIVCPYDVDGNCRDPECTYKHLSK